MKLGAYVKNVYLSPMFENYDKTISVLAYIPIIGWIIALILNSDKPAGEKVYNAFHLRQGLGLSIASILYSFVKEIFIWIYFIGPLAHKIIVIAFIGLVIFGILNAIKGRETKLPIIGKPAERYLGGAFE